MKLDYDFAMIELSPAEAEQYATDSEFRTKVHKKAADIADETDSAVEIRNADMGKLIETFEFE